MSHTDVDLLMADLKVETDENQINHIKTNIDLTSKINTINSINLLQKNMSHDIKSARSIAFKTQIEQE